VTRAKEEKAAKKSTVTDGWVALTWILWSIGRAAVALHGGVRMNGRDESRSWRSPRMDDFLRLCKQRALRCLGMAECRQEKVRQNRIHCTCPVGDNCKHAVATVALIFSIGRRNDNAQDRRG